MPRRMTATKEGTRQAMRNSSFESRVASWLMQDGWQVFIPILDHGHQTDLLISDGPHYYRVQVKTIDAKAENDPMENRWKDSNVDVVVYFARNSNWGYVIPAFKENRKKLKGPGHHKFLQTRSAFLKAFHKVG